MSESLRWHKGVFHLLPYFPGNGNSTNSFPTLLCLRELQYKIVDKESRVAYRPSWKHGTLPSFLKSLSMIRDFHLGTLSMIFHTCRCVCLSHASSCICLWEEVSWFTHRFLSFNKNNQSPPLKTKLLFCEDHKWQRFYDFPPLFLLCSWTLQKCNALYSSMFVSWLIHICSMVTYTFHIWQNTAAFGFHCIGTEWTYFLLQKLKKKKNRWKFNLWWTVPLTHLE